MQTLELNKETTTKQGFWRRQFQPNATESQKTFDWSFGVILPVVCFFFDPIVFNNHGILQDYKIFADLLSYTAVMALAAWLIWGAKLEWLNAPLAGLFAVVSAISLVIGVILFPFSIMGLIFLIGALGFTPLFTALVFLRNSTRAYHAAKAFLDRKVLVYAFVLSALFSAVVPSVINVEVNRHRLTNANNETPVVCCFD